MRSTMHMEAPGLTLDISGEWWEEDRFNRIAIAAYKTADERGFSFRNNVLPGLLARPALQLK